MNKRIADFFRPNTPADVPLVIGNVFGLCVLAAVVAWFAWVAFTG